jgi:hypothetical protein
MADPYPKKILDQLEGKIGELHKMRFWSKVDMRGPDECWEWQAARHGRGYGSHKLGPRNVTASRMALIVATGEEPDGMHVLHHCDNPPCCNPAHLYFGTVAQNNADKIARGRHSSGDQSGASNGAAKLSEDQVALIVERFRDGWSNKKIAADLPVSHSMVSLIRVGRMWRPVTMRLGWNPAPLFDRKAS